MALARYILSRLFTMLVAIMIILTFIFFAIHILPGDPVLAMVGDGASKEIIDQIRQNLGLDKPLHLQYFDYVAGIITGNLGTSIVLHAGVADLIWNRAGITIQLAAFAGLISVFMGVFLGKYSATKEGRIQDHAIRIITLLIYATPLFVIGIVSQLIFGVSLGILPLFGTHSYSNIPPTITGLILIDTLLVGDFWGFVDAFMHFLLPALGLGAAYTAVTLRLTRSETIKALSRTYCLLAEAKGLSKSEIVEKHAFRNALLPVSTVIGMNIGSLLTGSVLVETVFSLQGLGQLLVTAVSMSDYILTQGVITVFVLVVSMAYFIVDISYYFLDPRLQH